MRYIYVLLLTIVSFSLSGQNCLPGYNLFQFQEQIDDFIKNNPECTEIEGNLVIREKNPGAITSLEGFKNIKRIKGFFQIRNNAKLSSFEGMDSLREAGSVYFQANDAIKDFSGLENLRVIRGSAFVGQNDLLQSLNGFSSIDSITGALTIRANPQLVDISSLSSLVSVSGALSIIDNLSLETLDDLQNIDPSGIDDENPAATDLVIRGNTKLRWCHNDLICGVFSYNDRKIVVINNKAGAGCQSLSTVEVYCDSKSSSCKVSTMSKQSQLDDFRYRYYGCKVIDGDLLIEGAQPNDLKNVKGLSVIERIDGDLKISSNWSLETLEGLENLNHISGKLFVDLNLGLRSITGLKSLAHVGSDVLLFSNTKLESLEGLESMTKVNGDLKIQNLSTLSSLKGLDNLISVNGTMIIHNSNKLASLSGLGNLRKIGNTLFFSKNKGLESLEGIANLTIDRFAYIGNENLESLVGLDGLKFIEKSIEIRDNKGLKSLDGLSNFKFNTSNFDIYLHDNPNLEICNNNAMCEVVLNTGTFSRIYRNTAGCDTKDEVLDKCSVGTKDVLEGFSAYIKENPVSDRIILRSTVESIKSCKVYNSNGTLVKSFSGAELELMYVDDLTPGLYFLNVLTNEKYSTLKFSKS